MLFAVNALSNEISSLEVDERGGISLVDKVASGGERPNSITVKGDLLYVLNTGGSGNISGFRVSSSGRLSHIEGSTSALSTTATFPCPRQGDTGRVCSAAGPGQVQFTPQGDSLVVTERLTSRVLTYRVNDDGTATLANSFQSQANSTPFGFDFAPRGRLIVTNNFLDTPGLGAASSYIVNRDGNVEQVTGLLANNQTASCWVVIANQGRLAITSNPRTSNLTTYAIRNDGSISILNAVAASIINGDPHDLSLSSDERFLFALNNAHATVSSFKVEPDGTVTPLAQQAAVGFPAFSVGMAAR
jgi:hypothetical protein